MNKASTIKEVLIGAKSFLEDVGWCQGTFFRDANGKPMLSDYVFSGVEKAASACLMGAICVVDSGAKLDNNKYSFLAHCTMDKLNEDEEVSKCGLAWYNDHHTKEEVIALLDRTIAKLP